MIQSGLWVLHTATCVVDMVKRVWSGKEGDRFVDPNGAEHEVRVVELDGGDSFIDREGTEFQEISLEEVGFIMAVRQSFTTMREALQKSGVENKLQPRRVGILLASEFRYAARMSMGAFPPGSGNR